jgi:hypothetical protein
MSINKNRKLTSVKVDPDLFKKFKLTAVEDKVTLQKLVEVSMENYVKDIRFRNFIIEHDPLR